MSTPGEQIFALNPIPSGLTGTERIPVDQSNGSTYTTYYTTPAQLNGVIPQTSAEFSVDVTPVNYGYHPGHVFRYGVTANGGTDDTAAMNNTIAACNAGNYTLTGPAFGQILISSALTALSSAGGIDLIGISNNCTITASGNSGYTALTINSAPQRLNVCVNGTGNTVNGILLSSVLLVGQANIRAYNLVGFGVQINECSDCFFNAISVQACFPPATVFAFSMNPVSGNACEETVIGHLQVENCGPRAMYIDPTTFCCNIHHIHSEQSAGDGTNPTHVLGGEFCMYNTIRIEASSNVLVTMDMWGCNVGTFKGVGTNVQLSGFVAFANEYNEIHCMTCNNLTWLPTNASAWKIFDSGFGGTVLNEGALQNQAYMEGCGITNLSISGNSNYLILDNCTVSGSITQVGGNTTLYAKLCKFTNASPAFIANIFRECTFSATLTMSGNYDVRLCTFNGLVTIESNTFIWRSDGNTYAAGITLGGGLPSWRFGPNDLVTGGLVSAGLLAAPTSSDVAAVVGEKTWNLQPSATGVPYYVCTTAGTPGTWTAAPSL